MRKKVLILEDMETTRTALKRIVESCDDAITAYAFSEVGPALACMMENHIDLFFVDIILKPQVANDFSGIKFAEYVRQQEEYFANLQLSYTVLTQRGLHRMRLFI